MSDHPTALDGTCSARFDPLRELFAAKLESGEDLGASLAVNIDGEMVVDLWGGWAEPSRHSNHRRSDSPLNTITKRWFLSVSAIPRPSPVERGATFRARPLRFDTK